MGAVLLVSCGNCDNGEQFSTTLPGDIPLGQAKPPATPMIVGGLGVAPTPRDFPHHDADDVFDMFKRTADLGKYAIFIYQWTDADRRHVAPIMRNLSLVNGLEPIFAISPTTLDQDRREIGVPSGLLRALTGRPSFSMPEVRQAFIEEAEFFAGLHPPYLCLATEINLLGLQRMQEFQHFVSAYKEAYSAIKRISPETRVFVSFQFEFVRVLDNKSPGKIEEHVELIDVFRPELDLIAITTYPAPFYLDPEDMPANYYGHLRHYVDPGDEIMVMEIGWPSAVLGTPAEQRRFVELLPVLLGELEPSVTAWSLLHDVSLPAFGESLGSTGLITSDGEPKQAYTTFRKLHDPQTTRQSAEEPATDGGRP